MNPREKYPRSAEQHADLIEGTSPPSTQRAIFPGGAAALTAAAPPKTSSGIARAAGINSLGNVASRALGLVRESVISGTFGASGVTSVFDAISIIPKIVYELLIGGMLSAALVPVLSEYTTEERRPELEEILSVLLSLAGLVVLLVTLLLELGAPLVVPLFLAGFDDELLAVATRLMRIIVPAIFIYGISGIIQAYHYACKRFAYPAMGAPAHNLGMILAVVVLARRLDITSLSVGVLVAATSQLVVQLFGLRGMRLSLRFDWRHPVVRRLLQLYAPVVLSIVIQNIGILVDRYLASYTVEEAITWMTKATFLIQLPLGLVSMAVSLAVLPTLSQIDASQDLDRFKRILSQGLRLVLFVIIPAVAGLAVLGKPIIQLIFEHGQFVSADTAQSWRALCYYLPGLPFAAIDLLLVFAFYAQKDTVTPVIVGIVAVLIYLAVGPALAFLAGWGYLGLVVANSVQLVSHALIMLLVFRRRFHGLEGYGVMRTVTKAIVAALLVLMASYGSYSVLSRMRLLGGTAGELVLVVIPAMLGGIGYLFGAHLLGIEESRLLWSLVRRRMFPGNGGGAP